MSLRFHVDSTGMLVPRRLAHQDALLTAHKILSRRAGLEASLPDGHITRGKALLAALERQVAEIEALDTPDDAPAARAIPDAVRGLLPDAELASVGAVNHGVDNLVRAIVDSSEGALRRRAGDARREAAEVLREIFFAEGLTYLQLKSDAQWLQVDRRLRRLDVRARQAAVTLGIDDLLDELARLNAWFGALQGLVASTEPEPAPASRAEPRGAVHQALIERFAELLTFAQNAWPEASEAHAERRLTLIGPYLEALSAASAGSAGQPSSPPGGGGAPAAGGTPSP